MDEVSDPDSGVEIVASTKKGKKASNPAPHCDHNFVKNTAYKLVDQQTEKVWGEAVMLDPQPAVHVSRSIAIKTGDYVLMRGEDITLKSTGRSNTKVVFEKEGELILQKDWTQFDEDMTGSDLCDLGDVEFLLWWQCITPPLVPKSKRAVIPKKKAGTKARK
jgi:hypothetical protein